MKISVRQISKSAVGKLSSLFNKPSLRRAQSDCDDTTTRICKVGTRFSPISFLAICLCLSTNFFTHPMMTIFVEESVSTKSASSTQTAETTEPPTKRKKKANKEPKLKLPHCDCWSDRNTTSYYHKKFFEPVCCKRTVHYSHKMGSVLIQSIFDSENKFGVDLVFSPPGHITRRGSYFQNNTSKRHRDVMVTRNMVDSIISGYLYHKSGRECWLDKEGKEPVGNDQLSQLPLYRWEELLKHKDKWPWKAGNGRDICQYLKEESEYDGLRVFIDFSLALWYERIIDYWNDVKRRQDGRPWHFPRAKFMCYEDLVHPETKGPAFTEMMNWLYPAGEFADIQGPPELSFEEGHATDPDPTLRKRLRQLVEKFDRDKLDNWIAQADEILKCGVHKKESTSQQ